MFHLGSKEQWERYKKGVLTAGHTRTTFLDEGSPWDQQVENEAIHVVFVFCRAFPAICFFEVVI